MLALILMVAAFVCFVIAATGWPVPKVNLVAAGLACWSLSIILASGLK